MRFNFNYRHYNNYLRVRSKLGEFDGQPEPRAVIGPGPCKSQKCNMGYISRFVSEY